MSIVPGYKDEAMHAEGIDDLIINLDFSVTRLSQVTGAAMVSYFVEPIFFQSA